MSNENYERGRKRERDTFCVTPKSKNQTQMVVMNKEVGFESDYSRHFRFSDLGAAQTTFEGREYVTRTGLQQGWREILTSFARLLWRISKVIPSVKILEFSRSS